MTPAHELLLNVLFYVAQLCIFVLLGMVSYSIGKAEDRMSVIERENKSIRSQLAFALEHVTGTRLVVGELRADLDAIEDALPPAKRPRMSAEHALASIGECGDSHPFAVDAFVTAANPTAANPREQIGAGL